MYYPASRLLCLDIASHWLQMYSQLLLGKHHKDMGGSGLFLLRLYYTNRVFMGVCCVSAEVLYLAIHALNDPSMRLKGLPLPTPAVVHIAAGLELHHMDTAVMQVAVLAFPGWAIKQVANFAQMKSAADALVEHDMPSSAKKAE